MSIRNDLLEKILRAIQGQPISPAPLLDAFSDSLQAISNTDGGSTAKIDETVNSVDIVVNNGIVVLPGDYEFDINIDINIGVAELFAGVVEGWLEESTDNVTWSPITNSADEIDFAGITKPSMSLRALLLRSSNQRFIRSRFRTTTGVASAITSTISNGVVKPSVRCLIRGR